MCCRRPRPPRAPGRMPRRARRRARRVRRKVRCRGMEPRGLRRRAAPRGGLTWGPSLWRPARRLVTVGADAFQIEEIAERRVRFVRDARGCVARMTTEGLPFEGMLRRRAAGAETAPRRASSGDRSARAFPGLLKEAGGEPPEARRARAADAERPVPAQNARQLAEELTRAVPRSAEAFALRGARPRSRRAAGARRSRASAGRCHERTRGRGGKERARDRSALPDPRLPSARCRSRSRRCWTSRRRPRSKRRRAAVEGRGPRATGRRRRARGQTSRRGRPVRGASGVARRSGRDGVRGDSRPEGRAPGLARRPRRGEGRVLELLPAAYPRRAEPPESSGRRSGGSSSSSRGSGERRCGFRGSPSARRPRTSPGAARWRTSWRS